MTGRHCHRYTNNYQSDDSPSALLRGEGPGPDPMRRFSVMREALTAPGSEAIQWVLYLDPDVIITDLDHDVSDVAGGVLTTCTRLTLHRRT